jgi:hypothetical protein
MSGFVSMLAAHAGYSTEQPPLIDVSKERKRRVTVDREPGQYLGHPTTALLPDGKTIYVVYPKGHARGALVLKRSTDGGLTWSGCLRMPENWATSQNPPSINFMVGPDGRGRLIVLTGSKENGKEDYPVRLSVLESGVSEWTPLKAIGRGREYCAIVVASGMIQLKDGRYMAVQHSTYRSGNERYRAVYKIFSADGGLTWSKREVVTDALPEARLCEPGIIRSPDGHQLAVLLRANNRNFNSFIIFSNNEGGTWTEPKELPTALTGDKHIAKYAPDGRLVMVFRDMGRDSPTAKHFVAWVGNHADLETGGIGQYKVKLLHNYAGFDCGYAGLELLPDGTFVTTTYGRDRPRAEENHAVVSIRFKLDELDRKL